MQNRLLIILCRKMRCFLACILLFLSFCGLVQAAEKPPDSIYGTYSRSQQFCFVANNEAGMECGGYGNDIIEVKPAENDKVSVSIDLIFFNGHTCGFQGEGTWQSNMLVISNGGCIIKLRFRDNTIMTKATEECRMYCGARGSLNGHKLYKLKGLKGEEPPKPIIEALGEPLNTLWDANMELNKIYKQLFNSLDKEKQTTLRNEQRKWIAERDKKCESALPKSGTEEWLRYVASDETRAKCVLDATQKQSTRLLQNSWQ
jgi:hypothetical protein